MIEISIIVPAYNVENYITLTLNSLITQTSRKFELIIVNDGSTDNTLEVTKKIMANSDFSNYKIRR